MEMRKSARCNNRAVTVRYHQGYRYLNKADKLLIAEGVCSVKDQFFHYYLCRRTTAAEWRFL